MCAEQNVIHAKRRNPIKNETIKKTDETDIKENHFATLETLQRGDELIQIQKKYSEGIISLLGFGW